MTTVMFASPNGNNIFEADQRDPGSSAIQPPNMIQYIQCGGYQFGNLGYPPQQQPYLHVRPLEKFLRGEPKALGAIQIMIGLVLIGLEGVLIAGLVNAQIYYITLGTYSDYPLWGGLCFIISGSISVSSEKHLNTSLVKCSTGMNIVSAIAAFVGICLYIAELVINSYHVYGYPYYNHVAWILNSGFGVLILLFNVLEFCITVSAAHFGCQAVCCITDTSMVLVTYPVNTTRVNPSEGNLAIPNNSDVALPPKTET